MATYELTEVSRKERLGRFGGEMEITRVFHCIPYSARASAYVDLVGTVKVTGGKAIRVLPQSDPVFPWCRVNDVTCDTLDEDYLTTEGGLTTSANYSGPAVLTAIYRPMDLAQQSWEFSAQNLTLPNDRFGWDDGDPTQESAQAPTDMLAFSGISAVKTIPRIEYSVIRQLMVTKPTNTILRLAGRINKAEFNIDFDTAQAGTLGKINKTGFISSDTYPPGTLRFDSCSSTQKVTTQGGLFYELTYKFACMPVYDDIDSRGKKGYVTWNRLYDPRRGYWRKVTLMSNPKRSIYRYDSDIMQADIGPGVKGFKLLFDPRAR